MATRAADDDSSAVNDEILKISPLNLNLKDVSTTRGFLRIEILALIKNKFLSLPQEAQQLDHSQGAET